MNTYFEVENQLSIFSKQYYKVVKANELIQQTKYSLSAQEQKIILYLISKIKPDDMEFEECEFDITEFCKVAGIDFKNNGNFEHVKSALDNLHNQKFYINTDTHVISGVWVHTALYEKSTLKVSIKFNEVLKPYLLQLKLRSNYTSYELTKILAMKSKYSIRLYELLKSHDYKGHALYEIEKIRELLIIDKYPEYKEFKRNVIDRAVNEINKYTELSVSYEAKRKGRNITALLFNIENKPDNDITAFLARNDKLRKRKLQNEK